jgi:hypothetical protein
LSDVEYYEDRLADWALLEISLNVPVDAKGRVHLLAVPVGGSRRGGYLSVGSKASARRARTFLNGKPGFPNVRIEYSEWDDTCHVVRWGDDPPGIDWNTATDDEVDQFQTDCGLFYGYSEDAVREWVHGRDTRWLPVIAGQMVFEWEQWFSLFDAKGIVVNTYLPEGHDWRVRINTRHWE